MTDPSRKRRGCSPLSFLGCGCGLTALIGIAFVFLALSMLTVRERKDPRWNRNDYSECQMHLRNLGSAIESYRLDYKKLPTELISLDEHYISSTKWLRCPLERNKLGGQYRYTPLPAAPTDPLITCTNHAHGPIVLLHNGRLRLPKDTLNGNQFKGEAK